MLAHSRQSYLPRAGLYAGIIGAALGVGGLALTGCSTAPGCRAQVNSEYIGECVCPDCDTRIPHPRGVPCRTIDCPKCSTSMVRGAV